MASKDVSNGKMVPKAKTNASSLSNVPPRKYGAHSGLKFKYNLDKDSISKPQIDVGCRTEKKLSPTVGDGHPELKSNLERDTKKLATYKSKIEIEKQPPPEDEGHPVLKSKLQRDSKKNSATFESKTVKEKPPTQEEAHPGLKIKLENDSKKKSATFESQTEKEKPPPTDDEGNSGLKVKLEKDSKKKSATFQSKIEKEKHPPRKYGAHSGLKFKFNTEKNVIPKTFIFESLTGDTKGGATAVDTVTAQIFPNLKHKEVYNNSDEKEYASILEEEIESLRVSKSTHDAALEKNVKVDCEASKEIGSANICRNSVISLCELKPQPQNSKITNSQPCSTLKPSKIPSRASNLSPVNIRQISKGCTLTVAEPQGVNTLEPPEIASKASNLTSVNVRQISKGHSLVTKESPIPRYPDATKVDTITVHVVGSQTHKEENNNSGTGNNLSILKDDLKSPRKSGHNSISRKNVQENTKISIDNESEDLCSRVAKSLRVLQPQVQTLKISESKASDTSKPQATVSKTSKLPILNVQQNLRSQPRKIEEPMTPASPKKYGFHAGLRFSFKEKKTTPVDITFNRTPSVPKDKCFKNEKRDPAF